jgi:diguanylate cyclase (GGDEF)-like protein
VVPTTDRADGKQSVLDILQGGARTSVAPFAAIALASEASLLLPPGSTSTLDASLSLVFLALTAALLLWVPAVLLRRVALAVPLSYLTSVLFLILAAGGSSAGIGLVVLLPLLWAALTLDLWESVVVVAAVVLMELVTTYSPVDLSATVRLRREVSFFFVGGLIVFSIQELRLQIKRGHDLRDSREVELSSSIVQLSEQKRVTSVINDLVEMLNFCDVVEEAYEVFGYAARQIFEHGEGIYVLNRENGLVEAKSSWPVRDQTPASFPLELCRALEQGQPYASDGDHPRCAHFSDDEVSPTYCLPLLINRETIGLLVSLVPDRGAESFSDALERHHQYARLIGDQFSIWLANFRLRESLKNLSIRDPLTNLFNRRFMIETLLREMAITTRSHEQTSIIQIDIDNFKDFNDSFGHEVGDLVLCKVADVMFGLFRESDVPCRSGGEEFTLILPRCTWEVANDRATELQARVALIVIDVPENRARPQPPTLSIGIATSPEHGITGDELLRGADAAMYRAKNSGRNRIVRADLAKSA